MRPLKAQMISMSVGCLNAHLSVNNLLIKEQNPPQSASVNFRQPKIRCQSANPKKLCGSAFAIRLVQSPHISDRQPCRPQPLQPI